MTFPTIDETDPRHPIHDQPDIGNLVPGCTCNYGGSHEPWNPHCAKAVADYEAQG